MSRRNEIDDEVELTESRGRLENESETESHGKRKRRRLPWLLLMLIALEEKPDPATISSFVVGRNYRLDLRPQPHLELPWYGRHNRALMSLLDEFEYVKTFRYRNGLRELLFQRPVTA